MLKRNTVYNKGAIEYTQDGIRLKCSVAGTTGSTDIVVDQPIIIDGTVTWKLVDYAGIDYSLDEKKIGTWIDGKPLYQKTIVTTSPSVANTDTVVYSEAGNFDMVKLMGDSYIKLLASTYVTYNPVNMVYTLSNYNAVYPYVQNGILYISVKASSAEYLSSELVITIQYTKTTN